MTVVMSAEVVSKLYKQVHLEVGIENDGLRMGEGHQVVGCDVAGVFDGALSFWRTAEEQQTEFLALSHPYRDM